MGSLVQYLNSCIFMELRAWHLSIQHSVCTYCVPGAVPGSRKTAVRKNRQKPLSL